jgi:drug/metabolite transporter (DMT)-like permease
MLYTKDKKMIKGEILLLLTAALWGSCFLFQKKGMDYVGPMTLGAFRFIIGGSVLLPFIAFRSKHKMEEEYSSEEVKIQRKQLITGGIICGIVLFCAASLQQIGIIYTTSGKAAFLTSMEIVVVGILGVIITKKIQKGAMLGILLAVFGMYFLCMKENLNFEYGDIVVLIGAFFWGLQIMAIDKYSKLTDGIMLSCIQFFTTGVLSAIFMFIFEQPNISQILKGAIPILYTGIIEVAICYTFQIIGQKHVPPTIAAVTLSLESVFAVLFEVIFLHILLTTREVFGMILMLIAIFVTQIPFKGEAN